MSSLWRLANRVVGVVSPTLERGVVSDLDSLIDRMLNSAVVLWANTGWHRFDDREVNCTVQLHRWCREAIRRDPSLRILGIQMEWYQPTPEMTAGLADAIGMVRPDLRISLGQITGRTIECKRLSLKLDHPRRYVNEGLARFVESVYGESEPRAGMVGYIEADEPRLIAEAINYSIDGHVSMGPSHRMHPLNQAQGPAWHYESEHRRNNARPLRVFHCHIDLRQLGFGNA